MTKIAALIAWFLALGIHTAQRNPETGEAQRTTGRFPEGIAFYATSPRPAGKNTWQSKDGQRGGTKALAVINTPQAIDPETGEVTREASMEYVDVCFPQLISYEKGDHILARGNWVAGKPFVRGDGTASKWNDTLFVSDFCVIPASVRESAKLTAITVSETTPVETVQSQQTALFVAEVESGLAAAKGSSDQTGFPFGQAVSDKLADALATDMPVQEAVRSARRSRK